LLNLSKMRKPLVIIEAPGKIETFRKLLSGIGVYHAHIEATKGRLYDLPDDELGIDLNNFSISKLIPLSEKKIGYLKDHIEKSSDIIIFTDADIEGEVIAYQASQLVTNDKPIYRCETQSLTNQGIEEALSNHRQIDPKKVIAGYSRRVFDRLIGYGCSTKNWSNPLDPMKGNVGRILSPLLNHYHKEDVVIAKLQRTVSLNGDEFLVDIDIKKSQFDKIDEIRSMFNNIEIPSLREISSSIVDDPSVVMDTPTFLSGISESLEISILDSNQIIESLYEDGDASYPRTDSFYLSDETVKEITFLANHFGVSDFDPELLKEKAALMSEKHPSQEAHEGFHPISERVNPFSSLSSYDLEDQVMILLLRNTFRSGQKNRKIITRVASVDTLSKSINDWNTFMNAYSVNPKITRTITKINNKRNFQVINDSFSPMGNKLSVFSELTRLKIIPRDSLVFDLMRKLSVGRPSTMAYHATKISNLFISKDYSINYKGIQSMNKAGMLAPGLLSAEISNEIENELLNFQSNNNIKQRIESTLKKSGINIDSFIENINILSGAKPSPIKDESNFNY
jgi:DNA topoisomerase IA